MHFGEHHWHRRLLAVPGGAPPLPPALRRSVPGGALRAVDQTGGAVAAMSARRGRPARTASDRGKAAVDPSEPQSPDAAAAARRLAAKGEEENHEPDKQDNET